MTDNRSGLSDIIQAHPIGKGLDVFRASFQSICEDRGIDSLDHVSEEEIQDLAIGLLLALQGLRISRLLPSRGRDKNLLGGLSRLITAINSDDFDYNRIKPLLEAALADDLNDALVWDQAYKAVTESTPPAQSTASSLQQTPWLHNTGSFANSSEYRQHMDKVLRSELGPLYVGLPQFRETYFGRVAGLEEAAEAVFQRCIEGDNPIFDGGWRGWPEDANQNGVLAWFADVIERLATLAEPIRLSPARRPLAQPNTPIQGSTAERKLDVGFVNDPDARRGFRCHWSQILIPGELKSNPSADTTSKTWLDLGRYAREVLAAQYTRRYVLGFTICGSIMRVWEFDRLGGIASGQFDINDDGLQFVYTILGFLWMTEEDLGFDPTIVSENGQQYIDIRRNGQTERLVVDERIKRTPCVAGRATTCWKAYRKEDPQTPLVIKDSWQYAEREEEGELLQHATDQGVVNVARYYHHETVRVGGEPDEVRHNVRGGMNVTEARNYRPRRSGPLPSTIVVTDLRKGGSSSAAGTKRSSSQTGASLPANKRSCSASPIKAGSNLPPNRIHRRVIIRDYGKPIYEASSLAILLGALEGCIRGHESLHKAGLLHRDISANNLMVNEDPENPSWPSFLIDLDLAVREQREGASGAEGITGTKAFMAIGALLGEQQSFMHDLESFFWVLFWICIHYDSPGKGRPVPRFDKWNYADAEELAGMKLGLVAKEAIFRKTISDNFTWYYQPLIPMFNELRQMVFPKDKPWEREDAKLYARMREIFRKAVEEIKAMNAHSG